MHPHFLKTLLHGLAFALQAFASLTLAAFSFQLCWLLQHGQAFQNIEMEFYQSRFTQAAIFHVVFHGLIYEPWWKTKSPAWPIALAIVLGGSPLLLSDYLDALVFRTNFDVIAAVQHLLNSRILVLRIIVSMFFGIGAAMLVAVWHLIPDKRWRVPICASIFGIFFLLSGGPFFWDDGALFATATLASLRAAKLHAWLSITLGLESS